MMQGVGGLTEETAQHLMRLDVVGRGGQPTAEFYRQELAAFHEEQRKRREERVEVAKGEHPDLASLVEALLEAPAHERAAAVAAAKSVLNALRGRG